MAAPDMFLSPLWLSEVSWGQFSSVLNTDQCFPHDVHEPLYPESRSSVSSEVWSHSSSSPSSDQCFSDNIHEQPAPESRSSVSSEVWSHSSFSPSSDQCFPDNIHEQPAPESRSSVSSEVWSHSSSSPSSDQGFFDDIHEQPAPEELPILPPSEAHCSYDPYVVDNTQYGYFTSLQESCLNSVQELDLMEKQGSDFLSLHRLAVISDETRRRKRPRPGFTRQQLLELEKAYKVNIFLDRKRRIELADQLCLSERTVKIWFQNKRMIAAGDKNKTNDNAKNTNTKFPLQRHLVN